MAWTDPPAYIEQLRTQLNACASWAAAGGDIDNIHYPIGDAGDTGYPSAVLFEENVSNQKLFYGCPPVPSGELSIVLNTKTSTGLTEKLARDIAKEICTDDGLANLSVVSIDPASGDDAAEEATSSGVNTRELVITLTFGLEV